MRKIRVLALSLAIVAGMVPLMSSGRAAAASCYGSSCNNVDPYSSGCANDQVTLDQANITGGGKTWGTVYLKYSPTCEAAWTYISVTQGAAMGAWIENANGQSYGGIINNSIGTAHTPMQDSTGNIGQRAEGRVYPNGGSSFNYVAYTAYH